MPTPGSGLICTERTPRVVAARKLLRRTARDRSGRFLAEGSQAVHAALAAAAEGRATIHDVFATESALARHPDLTAAAAAAGAPVAVLSDRAAAGLSETVTPQGLVAVCDLLDVPLDAALGEQPTLVVVLVEAADPGNAGTVIRLADAAGADAVLLAGDGVDPHNGKCVRASVGSVFHLPLARVRDTSAALEACRGAGLRLLAAAGDGELDLDTAAETGVLDGRCAWLFGNEAHGLPPEVAAVADHRIAVPIHGRAESLNLATAAAVCVYATARAQGRRKSR